MRRLATVLALAFVAASAFVAPARAQTFDVSVKEMFAVSPDSVAKAEALQTAGTLTGATFERLTRSRFANRTTPLDTLVRFTGVLLSDPLSSGLATATNNRVGRVHVFVRDVKATADASGLRGYVVQVVDGAYDTDGLKNLAPGAVVRFTGTIAYFSNQPQLSPTSLEVLGTDYRALGYADALGRPITVALENLNKPAPRDPAFPDNPQATLNFANYPTNAYEYVRIEGARVETNGAGLANRFNVTYSNAGRTSFLAQNDFSLRYRNDRNADATYKSAGFNVRTTNYVPPAVGARVNLEGFTLPFTGDFVNYFYPNVSINFAPVEDGDVQVLAGSPPSVANVAPVNPVVRGMSAESVRADVLADPARTVSSSVLYYRPYTMGGSAAYTQVAMTAGMATASGTPYTGAIPAAALTDGLFVEYYVRATDNTGATGESAPQVFRVLANGIRRIEHVQRTASGAVGDSPFRFAVVPAASGLMQIDAVVQTRPDTSALVAIQDDAALAPWSGVVLEVTAATRALRRGDAIRITGATVTETSGLTVLTGLTFTKTGTAAAYDYKALTTTQLTDAPTAEQHEGILLRLSGVTVASTNPDAPAQFGEFTVATSGTMAAVRVDDRSNALFNKGYNATLAVGETFTFVQGLWYYANGQFKLTPEVASDLAKVVANEDDELPSGFALGRGYPNPVAGSARVPFRLEAAGAARLDVYDALGRRVAVLVDEVMAPGDYAATLDARTLAAGLYVVRLQQGARVTSRTVVVVK